MFHGLNFRKGKNSHLLILMQYISEWRVLSLLEQEMSEPGFNGII
jgi:hypothetical protein